MEKTNEPQGTSLPTDPRRVYFETEGGGMEFRTERRVGDVRIPNYVYDLWLPIIGADGLALYSVYCRLERAGRMKGMSVGRLAAALHVGKAKIIELNQRLVRCGLIRIEHPQKVARLQHHSLTIITLDAPASVSLELIKTYRPKGYEPLAPWLVGTPEDQAEPPAVLPRTASGFKQNRACIQIEPPLLQPLELQPLVLQGEGGSLYPAPQDHSSRLVDTSAPARPPAANEGTQIPAPAPEAAAPKPDVNLLPEASPAPMPGSAYRAAQEAYGAYSGQLAAMVGFVSAKQRDSLLEALEAVILAGQPVTPGTWEFAVEDARTFDRNKGGDGKRVTPGGLITGLSKFSRGERATDAKMPEPGAKAPVTPFSHTLASLPYPEYQNFYPLLREEYLQALAEGICPMEFRRRQKKAFAAQLAPILAAEREARLAAAAKAAPANGGRGASWQ